MIYTTIPILFVVLCVVRTYLTPRTSGFQQTDSCGLSPLESHHRRVLRRPRFRYGSIIVTVVCHRTPQGATL